MQLGLFEERSVKSIISPSVISTWLAMKSASGVIYLFDRHIGSFDFGIRTIRIFDCQRNIEHSIFSIGDGWILLIWKH